MVPCIGKSVSVVGERPAAYPDGSAGVNVVVSKSTIVVKSVEYAGGAITNPIDYFQLL